MVPENLNKLPLDERRDVISQITIISESGGDDIANLDEFIDEMGPEERISYEITKKLKRSLPFVPPRFREWYPTSAESFPLGWYL